MAGYTIEPAEDEGKGHRVRCLDNGTATMFEPGFVHCCFYCPECDVSIDVTITDESEWRELTEWC